MPTATVADVKEIIDTALSDADINDALDYAQERNEDVNDVSNQTTTTTKNIERFLAAVHIRETKEPAILQDSVGGSSISYESREIKWLRSQLNEWDPSGTLARKGIRDTNRHVTSTDES